MQSLLTNFNPNKEKMFLEKRSVIFAVILTISYIVWGLTMSLTPPFYPGEAEKKGATPSQVRKHN